MAAKEEFLEFEVDGEDETQNDAAGDGESDSAVDSDASSKSTTTDTDDDADDAEHAASDEQHDDGGDDSERKAIRERRRLERQEIKRRRQEREDSMRRELASRDAVISQMRQELDVINRRNSGSEMAQLETAKRDAHAAYAHFKDQIRVGAETNNGTLVADATEKMLQAQARVNDIARIENQLKQRRQQPQPLDPRIANHAEQWMRNNTWYDPNCKDPDSKITFTLDQALAEEGYDPTTPQYWEELSSRIKKYLPHRVKGDNITRKPKSVVQGSGGGQSGDTGKRIFRLSPERAQAIKAAGAWDDPALRDSMIKQYRDYDKQNGKN